MEASQNEMPTLYRVKFAVLLVLQLPSILVSLEIFVFFLVRRPLLKNLQYQALLLLLIIGFIQLGCDLPLPMHFYYLGYVYPPTPVFCTGWTYFEYSVDVIGAFLMATISVQRHILVFHEQLLRTRVKCFVFYYGPLLFCIVYPIVLYTVLILFYPCDGTQWDYTSNVCGFANCYLVNNKGLATFDWSMENGVPTGVIIISNVVLVVRVINQKRRHQGRIIWKKQRRLTLQLLSVSILFLIAWLPSLIIALVQQLSDPTFLAQVQKDYTLDLIFGMCLFLPYICAAQLPKFSRWFRAQLRCQRNARVARVGPA